MQKKMLGEVNNSKHPQLSLQFQCSVYILDNEVHCWTVKYPASVTNLCHEGLTPIWCFDTEFLKMPNIALVSAQKATYQINSFNHFYFNI